MIGLLVYGSDLSIQLFPMLNERCDMFFLLNKLTYYFYTFKDEI